MKSAFFIFAVVLLLLTGCAHQGTPKLGVIDIAFSEPKQLRFSGKGAGAGFMLASSLGPVGMAIGFAIDEGIGKDIEQNAIDNDLYLDQVITQALSSALRLQVPHQNIKVRVNRYAFKTSIGEGDSVSAELSVTYEIAGKTTIISLPSNAYSELSDQLLKAKFLDVKTDAALVSDLIIQISKLNVEAFVEKNREI